MVNVGEYSIHRAYGYDYILSFSKVSRVPASLQQLLQGNWTTPAVISVMRSVHAEIFVENESGKEKLWGGLPFVEWCFPKKDKT